MSDEKQQLSYEEFAALLKGSVALQARKNGDRYSKEDLLAAAREGRTRTLRTSEVRARIGAFTRYRHEGASVELRPANAVLLEHGTETLPLLDGYSEQEQRWIESELQAWLLRSNPTGVGPG